ncbi:hypothetical protein F5878DRAFT_688170 [Lentinula raphanica]|uniref:Uncharacterized protein n=1 Tax=Lentinula raphanica TaxID=153919 RepID=A0AA38P601_9AGAR|nr:hypothetical protein F5880DRAFT_1614833 [Lentinula raphanica]KAJ3836706.1 hypothetical protein F5878DRAFT_688170 [Lentinula raphanica]
MANLPPYISSEKVKNTIATAESFQYNIHNHEDRWHAPYSQVFTELTAPFDNIFAQVQFSQFVDAIGSIHPHVEHPPTFNDDEVSEHIDTQSSNDAEEPAVAHLYNLRSHSRSVPAITNAETPSEDETDLDPGSAGPADEDESNPADEDLNASTISSQSLHNDSVYVKPDVALLHVETQPLSNANSPESSPTSNHESLDEEEEADRSLDEIGEEEETDESIDNSTEEEEEEETDEQLQLQLELAKRVIFKENRSYRQVRHCCISALVELKSNIERQTEMILRAQPDGATRLTRKIRSKMMESQLDLVEYLAIAFRDYPRINEIYAISGTGARYQRALIRRNDLPGWNFQRRMLTGSQFDNAYLAYTQRFGPVLRLGTPESDADLTDFRDTFLARLAQLG